jgi:hypothetical protein
MIGRSSHGRPWLAALLGVIATGAGHLYLRRWLRALGWLALATTVTIVFVPEAALTSAGNGNPVPLEPFVPTLIVTALSVLDAYLVAKVTNRLNASLETTETSTENSPSRATESTTGDGPTARSDDDDHVDCPHCGKPLDPELQFCHWCSTDIGDFDAHRANRSQDDA